MLIFLNVLDCSNLDVKKTGLEKQYNLEHKIMTSPI